MATLSLQQLTALKPIEPSGGITKQLASGDTTVYTAPANGLAKLDPLVLTNISNGPVVVMISVVPAAGSLDATRRVGPRVSLPAGDSATFDEVKGWYPAGTYISVNTSAAAAVDVKVSGLEGTG